MRAAHASLGLVLLLHMMSIRRNNTGRVFGSWWWYASIHGRILVLVLLLLLIVVVVLLLLLLFLVVLLLCRRIRRALERRIPSVRAVRIRRGHGRWCLQWCW